MHISDYKNLMDKNKLILRNVFRERYRVFVEDLKWKIPNLPGEIDRDDFDLDETIYLFDKEGDQVISGCRLIPIKGSLLTTKFSHLVADEYKYFLSQENTYEISRLFISKWFREIATKQQVKKTFCKVLLGVINSANVLKAKDYLGFFPEKVYDIYARHGWHVQRIGDYHLHEGEYVAAGRADLSAEAYESIRKIFIDNGGSDDFLKIHNHR